MSGARRKGGESVDAGRSDNHSVEGDAATYYLRSSVLGNQVVAEMNASGTWQRGYVYLGGQLLVIQSEGVPKWVHQDPVTKSQRLTDYNQTILAGIDLDPWGGETSRSWQQGLQPRKYTTYERDGNGNDQAMYRSYHSYWQRFDQPDPFDGSLSLADPQSLNRYAYVQNDPVNFVDPSGLNMCSAEFSYEQCGGDDGFWGDGGGGGGGGFGDSVAEYNRDYYGLPPQLADSLRLHLQRVDNAIGGYGFLTSAQVISALEGREINELCFAGTCWYDGMGTITTTSSSANFSGLNPFHHPLPWRNPTLPNSWPRAVQL